MNLRLKGSLPGSAQKPKLKLAQITQGNSNQQATIQSSMKPRDISNTASKLNSNYQSTLNHERHVSFDNKSSIYNGNHYSTAAATIHANQGSNSKYGHTPLNGMTGNTRKKSPIDAQVSSSAYHSIYNNNNENDYDNIPTKLNSLAEEYKKRQQKMDDRLKQEIENHSVAQVTSNGKNLNVNNKGGNDALRKKSTSPLHNNESFVNTQAIINDNGSSQPSATGSNIIGSAANNQKFFRSQRSVAMRIKDTYENQVNYLEGDKLQLIQKLNDSLLELDKLNQEKSNLSNLLIEQSKFVRDMERETQKGEDISGVVNDDLRQELRSEKELSLQLKEDLKQAESERIRILQRIHELSQLTHDGQIRQSDMNIDFTVKTRTYEDILNELKMNIEDIARVEGQIDALRAQILANEDTIRMLREKLDKTVDDKRGVHHKITQLQDKYDEVVRNYQKERIDTDVMQSRHIKLISTNIMLENLKEILRNNLQSHFNKIKEHSISTYNHKRGLISLRNLFKQNKKNRLKRFLNLWYSNALKPMKMKKQRMRLAVGLRHKNPLLFAFYKWQDEFEISQSKTHRKKQIIVKMLTAKNDYHLRAVKYLFTKWRDAIRVKENYKQKVVIKFLTKRHREHIGKYFSRWVEISQELDNQIHLNGLAQRFAFKRYLSVLFSNWRLVTTDIKVKRISIINRAYKNMKTFTMMRKQMRCQTWSILREQKKNQENLIKACFDAMRVNKEQEKLVQVTHQLQEVEIPRRQQANEMISKVSQVDTLRYQQQAVNALSKCFGKKLFAYFSKWQQFTEQKNELINTKLKQRMLTCYLKYQRDAFTRWIDYKGHVLIQYQSEIILQEQEQIKISQVLIAQSQQEVQDKKQRQQCQSSKSIRKILNTAYEKRIKEHFLLWKANLDHKSFVQDNVEKVVMKLNRRHKRQAFDRYCAKVKEFRLQKQYDIHVDDMRLKLNEKLKKKIFNNIKLFSQNHLSAKNYLRRLLTRLDLSLKENTFKKWQKYENYQTVKALSEQQNLKVEVLNELQQEIQDKSDVLESSNQQNKKFKTALENNGRRILRLAFQRCLGNSQQYGFDRWVQYIKYQHAKERQIHSKLVHLFRYSQAHAFRTWHLNIKHELQIIYEDGIQSEENLIQQVEQESKVSSKHYTNDSDQANANLNRLKQSQQELMQKHQNCLKAMIYRVDNQDYISKTRYILQNWFQYVQNRKRCLVLMEKAINKTLWLQGLKAIKEAASEKYHEISQIDKSQLLVVKYQKIKLRFAFSQWRDDCKYKVLQLQDQYVKEANQLIKKRNQLTTLVKDRIQDQLHENRKYITLFDCYTAWKHFIAGQKQLRSKVQTYQEQVEIRERQRVVFKWKRRIDTTRKFRHVRQKLERVYNNNLKLNVFNAWQDFNFLNRGVVNSFQSLTTILDIIYVKRSFNQIKLRSDINSFKIKRSKVRGVQLLADKLSQLFTKKQSQIFNEMRVKNSQSKSLSMGQKATVKFYLMRKIREYFNQWKEESERKTVVQFMNEEGPVAVQNHILKKMLYNLKLKALQDGIKKKDIEQVIIEDRKKSIRGLEKSVCRLFCYNEEMYLLPKFLDKWKKWVQYRKLFKYWLNYLNNRADIKKSGIFWAFQKWKYIDIERYTELHKQPKEQLMKISCQNENKMQDLVNNLGLADATTDELTGQRDLLLQRYVGSQRLALSAINAQNDKTQQKALSRWIDQNSNANQDLYEDALKQNLAKIQALKDRIKYFERSNNDLAEQNEDLRQGALDGIEMAKSIDDLNREREKLSVDLADKAITIRKLLEDNNNLSIRLSNAQDEAQSLIKLSQMKLGKSSGGYYNNNDDY